MAGQKRSHDDMTEESSKTVPLDTYRTETTPVPKDDQMFTLIVGADGERHQVEMKHMTGAGKFFQIALKPCWREGQELVMRMPGEDPNLMSHYLYFLREDKLDDADLESDAPEDRQSRMFAKLASMYVLGERMLDCRFKRRVLEAFVAALRMGGSERRLCPKLDVATAIYDGTPPRSPARRLMVDAFASREIQPGKQTAFREGSDPDFIRDLERIHRASFDDIVRHQMTYWTPRNASDYRRLEYLS
ncbi:hypothetical protein LTR95_000864 [Oleoguttula sp. CCFEE 5521]